MSKLTQGLKMLMLLKSRGKLSRKELSELLHETPRNVLWLKEEVEKAGFQIKSVPGKHGGYELLMNQVFPEVYFSEADIEILKLIHRNVKMDSNALHQEQCLDLLDRLMARYGGVSDEFYQVYNSVSLNRSREELEFIYEQVKQAIESCYHLEFKYEKPSGIVSKVSLEPYYLIAYRNGWYVKGLKNMKERTYKLNRMSQVCVSEIPFVRKEELCSVEDKSFNFEDIHVELMIHNRNDISEYSYSENQMIKRLDKNTFLLAADMNEYAAWALIKNLGKDCQVLEPEYLKDRLVDEARAIIEEYEKEEQVPNDSVMPEEEVEAYGMPENEEK